MHVVHLEDESPLQEILKVAFEAAMPSITLKQFVNSDHAVDYIEKHIDDIDLYILDIRVPGQRSGVEVAQRIRELGSNSVIAVTSAYRTPERKVLKELDCEWVAKPWHIMNLLDNLIPKIREKKKENAEAAKPSDAALVDESAKPNEPAKPLAAPADETIQPAQNPTAPQPPMQGPLPDQPEINKPGNPPGSSRSALMRPYANAPKSTRITLDKNLKPEGDKKDNS